MVLVSAQTLSNASEGMSNLSVQLNHSAQTTEDQTQEIAQESKNVQNLTHKLNCNEGNDFVHTSYLS